MRSPDNQQENEARIVKSFSKFAKSYDRHAQLQKTMAERLASMLPDQLPACVTELGCGTGLFTRHILARPLSKLVLNDISPGMIEHLKERMTLPENTQLIVGNAERVAFVPTDLMVANAVFQWFADPVLAMSHLHRFMNPEGGLLFSTFGPGTLKEFRETADLKSPASLYSYEQWQAMIGRTGLHLIESHFEIRKSFFPNTRALIHNLQQIGAAPHRLLKPGGLRKLIREYDERFRSGQGVYATWEIYYFSARR